MWSSKTNLVTKCYLIHDKSHCGIVQNLVKRGILMKENLMKYVEFNFPNLTSEFYLRFDLGFPYKNGTIERMNQVNMRVTSLFEEVFKPDDFVYLYIKDYGETEDIMFGNNTPAYLADLLSNHNVEEEILYDIEEDYDELTG